MKFTTVTAWLISAGLLLAACRTDLPKLIENTEPAIFKIFMLDKDGDALGTASGFFIDEKGTAVTNHHVLGEAASAFIKLWNGEIYPIEEVISERADVDLCMFKVRNDKGRKFTHLQLQKSLPTKGSEIFVIGSPKGLDNSVSTGIVSAIRLNEYLSESYFEYFPNYYNGQLIQFTAPFYHGNSGSPIMNMDGEVVGVGAAGAEDQEGGAEAESINIAVPIRALDSLAPMDHRLLQHQNSQLRYVFADAKDHPLIINSIELEDSMTVMNCKYFNFSLFDDPALLYTKWDSTQADYFIEDQATHKHYRLTGSDGISNEEGDPDSLYLGESRYFTLYFEPLPKSVQRVNVLEGNDRNDPESWNFYDIELRKPGAEHTLNVYGFFKSVAINSFGRVDPVIIESTLQNYLQFQPDDHEAHSMLGYLDYARLDYDNAIQHYSDAIASSQSYPPYYANRSICYYSSNHLTKAVEDITFAIDLNDEKKFLAQRVNILMEMEEWPKAIDDINYIFKFGELTPQESGLYYHNRGDCYLGLNKSGNACQDWHKAYTLHPDQSVLSKIQSYCR